MHYAGSTAMHCVFEMQGMKREVRKGSGDF